MRLRLFTTAGFVLSLVILSSVSARADEFSFSANLNLGPDQGLVQGTFDLGFITLHGSGTGAATSLTLTSIPAGFGTLAGGDVATAWALQGSNTFTVVNGIVTSDLFAAASGSTDASDALCLNSTANLVNYASNFQCFGLLNELHTNTQVFADNASGLAGIQFTDITRTNPSVTPEPSSIALLVTGMACVAGVLRKRKVSLSRSTS